MGGNSEYMRRDAYGKQIWDSDEREAGQRCRIKGTYTGQKLAMILSPKYYVLDSK